MSIQWQRVYGGIFYDYSTYIRPAGDGYILSGTSEGFQNAIDMWIARLDAAGNILWQGGHGGSSFEFASGLMTKADGSSYSLAQSGSGISGDKTTAETGPWLIKLNPDGTKAWDVTVRQFSSSVSIAPRSSSGVLVGFDARGGSFSVIGPGGIIQGTRLNAGATRYNDDGTVLWSVTHHLAFTNRVRSIIEASDGSIMLAGNAPIPESNWRSDYFLMKLTSVGGYEWGRTYGGITNDSLRIVRQTPDGGFLLIGESESPASNTKTSVHYGGTDCWIVKVDAQGNKLWDKTYGGSGTEQMFDAIVFPDGGFLVAGGSDSTNGNKTTPNYGGLDGWIFRCDAAGNKLWEQILGGDNLDGILSFNQTSDGGFIVGLETLSGISGNKTLANSGPADYWVVKLAPEPPLLRWEKCCADNGFSQWSLMLNGTSNVIYHVETSSDLTAWTTLRTNRLSGSQQEVMRHNQQNPSPAYYRARVVQP